MVDGTLLFETGINNQGFRNGLTLLENAASVAIGNIATNIISDISNVMAQIPTQMINVGSSFEASMSQVAATSAITERLSLTVFR